MTSATLRLFTLAECWAAQQTSAGIDPQLRQAMANAANMVSAAGQACILCGGPIDGAPCYVSILMPQNLGFFWLGWCGGVCVKCGTPHERAHVQRHAEHHAHLMFGEVAGHA